MALDGLFLHHLLNEIKEDCINKKIYKIISINDTDYVFCMSSKKKLYISVNPSYSHIRFTEKEYLPSNSLLTTYFKKHIEGGIIKNISQYKNDRQVCIEIDAFDELGYSKEYKIYLELMGKNSNLIITTSSDITLEAVKKSYLTDTHLVKTGMKYERIDDGKVSPFECTSLPLDDIEGLSKQVKAEIEAFSLDTVLNYPVNPVLIYSNKVIFYYTDLKTIYGERKYFDSLSSLLEYYYDDVLKASTETSDLINTRKYLNKELEKSTNKLDKQLIELENAKNNDTFEKYANLLKANFHLIKPYTKEVEVIDYENGSKVIIPLNPKLKPSENIDAYFNKIKKNKRTVISLQDTIEDTKKEIAYYNENLTYLDFSKVGDLKEIMYELGLKKMQAKNTKPHIAKYVDSDGNTYYFGKNNTQNNYLTHVFASSSDYWFHAKSIPGSHVILKGELTEKSMQIASNIASYYSKAKDSYHVCVDYTLVKWVKKIKGEYGSNVIYTHEKTTYSDPSIDFIEKNAKLIN